MVLTHPSSLDYIDLHHTMAALAAGNAFPIIIHNKEAISAGLTHFYECTGFLHVIKELLGSIQSASGARGRLYEIERALELKKSITDADECILSFDQEYRANNCKREFDIITTKRAIECKAIKWSRPPYKAYLLVRQFEEQKEIIDYYNQRHHLSLQYQVSSKYLIPALWRQWFRSRNINWHESDQGE